jgi:hypothetical protein
MQFFLANLISENVWQSGIELKFECKNNSLLLLKFKENPLKDPKCILDNKHPALLFFFSKEKNIEKSELPDIPVKVKDLVLVKLLNGKELVSSHVSFWANEASSDPDIK